MANTFPVQQITRHKVRTALLGQGQRMSNWLFNMKQDSTIPQRYREEAERLQKAWDELKDAELKIGKAVKRG